MSARLQAAVVSRYQASLNRSRIENPLDDGDGSEQMICVLHEQLGSVRLRLMTTSAVA